MFSLEWGLSQGWREAWDRRDRTVELLLRKEAPSSFYKPSVSTHPLIQWLYLQRVCQSLCQTGGAVVGKPFPVLPLVGLTV